MENNFTSNVRPDYFASNTNPKRNPVLKRNENIIDLNLSPLDDFSKQEEQHKHR